MAESKGDYKKPIYKANGKGSFLEAFDSMEIGKIQVIITLYDENTHKVTQRAQFYINYPEFLALSTVVSTGAIDSLINTENFKAPFPKYGYTEGKNLRTWSMEKTEKQRYKITITEKEVGKKWEEATVVGKASFYILPFTLIAMCKAVELCIQSHMLAGTPVTERESDSTHISSQTDDLGM